MKIFKRIMTISVATLCLVTPVFAGSLHVNNVPVPQQTIMHNGSTFVPLRAVAEMLGAQVNYDNTTGNTNLVPTNSLSANSKAAFLTVRASDLLIADALQLADNLTMLQYEVMLSQYGLSYKTGNLLEQYNKGLDTVKTRLDVLEISFNMLDDAYEYLTGIKYSKFNTYNTLDLYNNLGFETVESIVRLEKLQKKYDASLATQTIKILDNAIDYAWDLIDVAKQVGNIAWDKLDFLFE